MTQTENYRLPNLQTLLSMMESELMFLPWAECMPEKFILFPTNMAWE